jgi:hypothetical protein
MNPFDQRIGRQYLQRAAVRRYDRRIVANPNEEHRVGRWDAAPNPFDQGALAGVGDALGFGATGRTQRRASP